jgi:hypothetical protein
MSFVAGGRATEKALNDIKLLIESLPIFANGSLSINLSTELNIFLI